MEDIGTDIGTNAGKVWQFLHDKGPKTMTEISRGTGLAQSAFDRAIGWLAREGKIRISENKTGAINKRVVSLA